MKHDKIFSCTDSVIKPLPSLNGLVLSGGQSTRMGRDKGEIQYHNKSQRRHVYELLSFYCASTFVSCNSEQSNQITDLPKIEDVFFDLGPLGGILSAFQHNPNTAWLAVACDLPFLDKDTVAYLINHRNVSKMATAFWNTENNFPEPLVTVWEPYIFPFLLASLHQGGSSPGKILMNADIEWCYAPDEFVFKNVNTLEEYEEAWCLLNKPA